MKKVVTALMTLSLLFTMCACSFNNENSDNSTKDETSKKESTSENKTSDESKDEGSIDDVMDYLKENGITYSDDQDLSDFDWAAKEGKSFTYDGNTMYLYRVDTSDETMNSMLDEVQTSNAINATQNGSTQQYGAANNGSYLLIYDKDANVDDIKDIFNKYKNDAK